MEGDSIPKWAADLQVTAAEIKGLASRIPDLTAKVEKLWDQSTGQQQRWTEVTTQVDTLWSERERALGTRQTLSRVAAGIGLAAIVVGIIVALKQLGFSITIK